MKLAELQSFFAEAATSGTGPRPGLEQVFVGDARLCASDRLAIYNRGYYYRLLDAISSVFPQTQRHLGGPELRRLALGYLAQNPSQHPAVERVGRLFPEYLRGLGSVSSEISDLAALEWARLEALVAPDPKRILVAHEISPADFSRSRLCFVPSLRCLELDAAALGAFAGTGTATQHATSQHATQAAAQHATQAAAQPAAEPAAPLGLAPSARCAVAVAVWRRQHVVLHERLETADWEALQLAAAGASVSQICACFDTGAEAADAQRAFRVLASWFARQWLESVDLVGA